MRFRRLPIRGTQDTTQNFEQLQSRFTTLKSEASAITTNEEVKQLKAAILALKKALETLGA